MLGGCITVYGLYSMVFLVRRCNICGMGGGGGLCILGGGSKSRNGMVLLM